MFKRSAGEGDCFIVAFENTLADHDLLLCYGVATGRGPIEGVRFSHAWNETSDGMVIDQSNGLDVFMPKDSYYAVGEIGDVIYRYDYREAAKMALDFGTYGPWEEEFERYAIRKETAMARNRRKATRRKTAGKYELARQLFVSLMKTDHPYVEYFVQSDGNTVDEIFAASDEEAIALFLADYPNAVVYDEPKDISNKWAKRAVRKRALWQNTETGEVFDTREEAERDAADLYDFGDPTNAITDIEELPYIRIEGRRKIASDGWDADICEGLISVLADCERLSYEVNNARRGSYCSQAGDTFESLGRYAQQLGEELSDAGAELEDEWGHMTSEEIDDLEDGERWAKRASVGGDDAWEYEIAAIIAELVRDFPGEYTVDEAASDTEQWLKDRLERAKQLVQSGEVM